MIDRTIPEVARPTTVFGLENFDRGEVVGGFADGGRSEKNHTRDVEGRRNMPRTRIVCDEQIRPTNQRLETPEVEHAVEYERPGFHRGADGFES